MKAIVQDSYGPPEVLEHRDIDRPVIGDGEVLIRVHSASVNPLDWHMMTGTPYLLRMVAGLRAPKQATRGVDVAGRVEDVGAGVVAFAPGARVFGAAKGGFAEYAVGTPEQLIATPDALPDADAAALPVAAITALQALRDLGHVRPGQSVLVNGAAGGVGTFAVQIAVAMGAEVTGVCSARNVDVVRSLGATRVVDYTSEDVAADGVRFDVIIDNVGNRTFADCRRMLAADGVLVMVSGPKRGRWIGPYRRALLGHVRFRFGRQRFANFVANESAEELRHLVALIDAGHLRSVIDRRYPLRDTAEAVRYVATGHARAKVVIDVHADPAGPPTAPDDAATM